MSGKSQNAAAMAMTLGATAVARKAADSVWKMGSKGKTPPTDPTDPDVELREAILFAVISGVVVSVARTVLARKLAARERRELRAEHSALPRR
jgi:hypothetical protein